MSAGVQTVGGGLVVNGSAGDKKATIKGVSRGIASFGGITNVTNFGTVRATSAYSSGVYEYAAGATVTNGSSKDKLALITGAAGVLFNRSGTLVNGARIIGVAAAGAMTYGGLIENTNATAVIQGVTFGIRARGAQTVINFGSVLATGGSGAFGLAMNAGGALTNGSVAAPGALIQGFGGAYLSGGTTATNFGAIVGAGAVGVTLGVGGAATLVNFGTVAGKGGVAVQFGSPSDSLLVEAGSSFSGAVNGDGGTIVLAGGVGALTLLAGDSLMVSGSIAATTFSNFAAIGIGSGATFTDSGAVTIAIGQTLRDSGTLVLGGSGAASVVNAGTLAVTGGALTVNGAVTGAGVATINGGTLSFFSSFTQTVAFTGTTGGLILAQARTYAGSISGFSLTGGTSLDLRDIAFVGAGEASFSGTAASGTLIVSDGVHVAKIMLVGDFLASSFTASSDGHGGVLIVDPPGGPAGVSTGAMIGAMAGLGGGAAPCEGVNSNATPPRAAVLLAVPTAL